MNFIKCVLIAWLVLNQATISQAQWRNKSRFIQYDALSLGVGSSTYFGDLASYSNLAKSLTTLPRWNASLGYTRQFTPHFAGRAQFTWARIVGDDYTYSRSNPTEYAAQFSRNLHFRNDVKEVSITGIYSFIADGDRPAFRAKFTPYVFGGLAVIAHNPEARTPTNTNGNNGESAARQWVQLQPLHTEGQGGAERDKAYSLVTVAIPAGLGVRYRLNENLNLGFELGFRYTFTNYLDDVSGQYDQSGTLQGLSALMGDRRFEFDAARVNISRYTEAQQLFQNQPALFTTSERGSNTLQKDSYLLSTVSIQYIFPGRIKCPPLR
ncbi:DUF6089 family protein [Spirosoma gilvum]